MKNVMTVVGVLALIIVFVSLTAMFVPVSATSSTKTPKPTHTDSPASTECSGDSCEPLPTESEGCEHSAPGQNPHCTPEATDVPPTDVPPTDVPPTDVPPTDTQEPEDTVTPLPTGTPENTSTMEPTSTTEPTLTPTPIPTGKGEGTNTPTPLRTPTHRPKDTQWPSQTPLPTITPPSGLG